MEARLLSYLYFFNIQRDYYECHEYGESLWLDSGRPVVLKGLIQAAVCLYHLENGNIRGGYRMWQRAKQYLHDARPVYEGMDLDALVADIDAVYARVPESCYRAIVSQTTVKSWHLPVVHIRLTNSDLVAAVETWQPPDTHP